MSCPTTCRARSQANRNCVAAQRHGNTRALANNKLAFFTPLCNLQSYNRNNAWFASRRMRRGLLPLGIIALLLTTPVVAQNRVQGSPPIPRATYAAATESGLVLGKWTYRSYFNTAALVTDADSALAQIFGQGVFTFETPSSTAVTGTFDMGGGLVLDVKGTIRPAAPGSPLARRVRGQRASEHRYRRLAIRLPRLPGAPVAEWRGPGSGIGRECHPRQATRRLARRLRGVLHRGQATLISAREFALGCRQGGSSQEISMSDQRRKSLEWRQRGGKQNAPPRFRCGICAGGYGLDGRREGMGHEGLGAGWAGDSVTLRAAGAPGQATLFASAGGPVRVRKSVFDLDAGDITRLKGAYAELRKLTQQKPERFARLASPGRGALLVLQRSTRQPERDGGAWRMVVPGVASGILVLPRENSRRADRRPHICAPVLGLGLVYRRSE